MEYPVDHVSYTQLNLFDMCPAKWYYNYVRGIRDVRPSRMILGSAIDAGLSHNFGQKIESHEDLPEQEVIDFYAAKFDNEVKDDQRGEVVFEPGETRGGVLDEGVGLLMEHYTNVTPSVQPVASQRRQEADILLGGQMAGKTVHILAFPDLITNGEVVDFKVVKKTPSSQPQNHRWQLAICDMTRPVSEHSTGLLYVNDYLVRLKKPKVLRLSCVPVYETDDIREFVIKKIGWMLHAIERDVIIPNRSSYLCKPMQYNENFDSHSGCAYWSVCHNEF